MNKKLASKSEKVYCVTTNMLESGGDSCNWSSYNILAIDAQDAIEKTVGRLQKDEYVSEVEIVCVLDD